MDTLEEIAYQFGLCNCDEAYKNRGLTAPDCPWHAFAIEEAMKEACRQACEEQRQICYDNAKITVMDVKSAATGKAIHMALVSGESIKEAPLPDIK